MTEKLFNRNFLLLWQGHLVSQLGSHAYRIALMLWVKELTGSATVMGLLMMTAMIPGILLGPLGGTIADHYSRRKILICCDLVNGIAVLLLTGVVYFKLGDSQVILAMLFGVALLGGITLSLFGPAVQAAIPDLVPEKHLTSANSLNQLSSQLASIVGRLLGGTLRLVGPVPLFFLNGLSFLFSAASEVFIKIPQEIPDRKSESYGSLIRKYFRETGKGFSYVWREVGPRNLFFGVAAINFFLAPFAVALPFYVETSLGTTSEWYAYCLAAMTVGTVLGLVFISTVKGFMRWRKPIMLAILPLLAVLFGVLGSLTNAFVALAVFAVMGFLTAVFNVHVTVLLQMKTDKHMRGRVFGLLSTLGVSLNPIALGLTGVLVDYLNGEVNPIFLVCGGMLLLVSAVLSSNRPFRQFIALGPPPAKPAMAEPEQSLDQAKVAGDE